MPAQTFFPWRTVIGSFNAAEKMLQEVVNIVPYCPAHETVWSPSLVTVLLEVGSLLDSLWKTELELTKPGLVKRPNIKDYFQHFATNVAGDWLVFWGEEGERVQPFSQWAGVKVYDKASYRQLGWWQAYNKVKHDRLANREMATLVNAVHAVAALFIAMLRCPFCAESIAQEDWVPSPRRYGNIPAQDFLGRDSHLLGIVAESKLLSFPLNPNSKKTGSVSSRQSHRFLQWCDKNGVRFG